jgi:dihydroxyacetone kinase-like protein
MMDAIVPAIAAMRAAAEAGKSVSEALHDASAAAKAGAEATRNFTARHGRAKFLGEKTRGHPDPGATSMSLMFAGFCSAFEESKGEPGNA